MKKIIALVFMALSTILLFGEAGVLIPKDWEVGSGYQYNMSLYAQVVDFDGKAVDKPGSVLGVFGPQGECRGYARIEGGPCGLWYQVLIASDAVSEKGLVLKVLDSAKGEIFMLKENIDFLADSTIPEENYAMEPMVLHYKPLTVDLTLELVQNWNWISFNVQQGERNILEFLEDYTRYATNGDIIKSQKGQATFSNGKWYPSPSDFKLEPGKMYKLRKQAEGKCSIVVNGMPGSGDDPIAVVAGWNWIGYTGEKPASINAIFKEGGFATNDVIKPQSGSQGTFSGGKWYGNMIFSPGIGYMLKQASAGVVDFRNAEENEAK